MKISRGLWNKLAPRLEQGQDLDTILEDLLFEVPDETLDRLVTLRDPVEVKVSARVRDIMTTMAEDMGLSPLGLCVTMEQVYDKTMDVQRRFEEYKAREYTT